MSYHYSLHHNGLHQLSNSFFQIQIHGESEKKSDLIIPDCTPGIMVIEEGRFIRKYKGTEEIYNAGSTYLFGQKTKSVEYEFDKNTFKAYGYKLQPAGLFVYFGIKAEELTDDFTVLKDSELPSSFWSTYSKENPFTERKKIPLLLKVLLNEIHHKKGNIPIKELADRHKIGYKRGERLFKQYIGISPKMYSRIVRFNQSVKLFDHPLFHLTDIAYQAGFFDQNHFIKETKKFTGHTPSRLLALKKSGLEKSQLNYLSERGF